MSKIPVTYPEIKAAIEVQITTMYQTFKKSAEYIGVTPEIYETICSHWTATYGKVVMPNTLMSLPIIVNPFQQVPVIVLMSPQDEILYMERG